MDNDPLLPHQAINAKKSPKKKKDARIENRDNKVKRLPYVNYKGEVKQGKCFQFECT